MNTTRWSTLLGIAAGFIAIGQAQAQTTAINQNGSLVEMCASAQMQVPHDKATASISVSSTQRDKIQAADVVNGTMKEAIQFIKQKYPRVSIENQVYNTYQERDKNGQLVSRWTVAQGYSLVSKNVADIPALVAQLQGMGVNVSGMSTYLSTEGRRLATQQLDEMAFADVKTRIASVAKAFGQPASAWRIAHMNIMPNNPCNSFGRTYAAAPVMMKASMEADAVEQPELVSGQEEMSVNFYIAVRAK